MKTQTNSAVDGLWAPFSKKFAKTARAHRAKFLPDDQFNCNTLARVARAAVDDPETGLKPGTVVEVVQVYPPQISNDFTWRRMKRPYLPCLVQVDGEERMCNLESLEPVA